jgi:hypothetical protein
MESQKLSKVYLVSKSLQLTLNEFSRSRTASSQESDYNYKSNILDSNFYVESKYEDEKRLI